jgi:hypothetical protein
MAKTPSLSLKNLINALTGSEKRYFKLYVGEKIEKESKYLILFDLIDQGIIQDEDELKQAVYEGDIGESRKFSELKSYLFELTLRALQAYDTKGNVNIRLQELLQGTQVLFRRSLFKEAKQNLGKAKKLASKYEEHLLLLEIIRWEKKIAYALTDIKFLDEELENLEREERYHLAQYQLRTRYRNTFFKLLINIRKQGPGSGQGQHLQQLVTSIKRLVLPKETGHNTKVIFYRLISMQKYIEGDIEGFIETNILLMKLLESEPHFLKQEVSEYISVVNNLLIGYGTLEKFDKVLVLLEKFKTIKAITTDDELKIHRQYYMNLFAYYIHTGAFDDGIEAFKEHQKFIKKNKSQSFLKHSFYFQYFYLHFGAAQFDLALQYLNDWLDLKTNTERHDLQALARILNLLIHKEMGNTILIHSLTRSATRFLNKNNKPSKYEEAVLKYFRRSINSVDRSDEIRNLETLLNDIRKIKSNRVDNNIMNLFDMESWVISKLKNIPFMELKKQQTKL